MMNIKGGRPDYDPLTRLRTDAGVLDCVDQLVGPDARRDRLCLLFLDADAVQLPVVVSIDDVPASPDPGTAESICGVIANILNDGAPGGSAVITLVRQNELGVTDSDHRWLVAFRAAAEWSGVHLRMFCLATRDGVRRLDSDDGQLHGLL